MIIQKVIYCILYILVWLKTTKNMRIGIQKLYRAKNDIKLGELKILAPKKYSRNCIRKDK